MHEVKRSLNEYNIDERFIGLQKHSDFHLALSKVVSANVPSVKKTLVAMTGDISVNRKPLINRHRATTLQDWERTRPKIIKEVKPKGPRGRPRKVRFLDQVEEEEKEEEDVEPVVVKRKRGRPRKIN